jgi:hypothetical protein
MMSEVRKTEKDRQEKVNRIYVRVVCKIARHRGQEFKNQRRKRARLQYSIG